MLLEDLLNEAVSRGNLGTEALQILKRKPCLDLIDRIWRYMPAEISTSSLLAVTLVADNSGSIKEAGREQDVIDGTNAALDVFAEAPNAAQIYVQVVFINGLVLEGWKPARDTVRLSSENYTADGGTPLFDTTIGIVGANVALAQLMSQKNVPTKTSSLIVTDGRDEGSYHRIEQCETVVRGALTSRRKQHILGAMGIGACVEEFQQAFLGMGILPKWICLPGESSEKLMNYYLGFSKSSVTASQSGGDFARTQASGIADSAKDGTASPNGSGVVHDG